MVASYLGYTDHLKLMVKAFLAFGKNVFIRPIGTSEHLCGDYIPIDPVLKSRFVHGEQPEEWELLLSPPTEVPTPGKKTVYFTMWESTKLRASAVEILNKAQIVVVPCDWNKHCFKACGVTAPIMVCPLGMDPDVFKFHPMPEVGPFVFGAAGRLVHGEERKGVNQAIEAFLEEFPDDPDVRLRVKCFKDDPLKPFEKDPRIDVDRRYKTDRQMAQWLSTLNVFVAPARGEGWGAIQHQAMMVGRPVIGCPYSGSEMFMSYRTCSTLRYSLGEPSKGNFYEGLGYWAIPDHGHLRESMATYRRMPVERVANRGVLVSTHASRLTHLKSNQALLEVLEDCGAI